MKGNYCHIEVWIAMESDTAILIHEFGSLDLILSAVKKVMLGIFHTTTLA